MSASVITSQNSGNGNNYTVQSGDTLSGIAKRQGISLAALEKDNPQIKNPDKISIGESINLPQDAGSSSSQSGSQNANSGSGGAHDPGVLGTNVSRWDKSINQAASKYGVDPDLIRSVIFQESSGNPNPPDAGAGAVGLMQLMPGTAAELGVNPYIPAQNIMGGTEYLSQLLNADGGNMMAALQQYSGGASPALINSTYLNWYYQQKAAESSP